MIKKGMSPADTVRSTDLDMTVLDQYDLAKNEGWSAGNSGVDPTRNPYAEGTFLCAAWLFGWGEGNMSRLIKKVSQKHEQHSKYTPGAGFPDHRERLA